MTDIRQPLSKDAVRRLVQELADPEIGCASGELGLTGDSGAGFYWKYESLIRRGESRFRSLVGVTGALYVIRKADLTELPENLVLDDMWTPMHQRLQGKRVVLVPGAIAYDEAFEDPRELPRKVRTLAGNYQLFALMPRLLVPFVNPSWFETISHKVLRLLCPWALLALFTSSLVLLFCPPTHLPRSGLAALVGAQMFFYLLALLGQRAGRIGRIARTFVVLNAAAILGLFRYLKNPRQIPW
jgi:cellulose synthase/poly-beta-1,6-N-acetylglucosamine synthase-like glycosyltransferase